MSGEGNSLLMKVGVIMMALTLALVIAAVVVSVALHSEPGRVLPAGVVTKYVREAPRYSSGEEGSATKKYSSEKESPRYPFGEKSLEYGSSSSGGPVRQRKEDAKEPRAVLRQEDEPLNSQSEMPQLAGQQTPSEAPSKPEPQPQQHQSQPEGQFLPGSEERGWQRPPKES